MAADATAKADEMQARNEKSGPLHGLPVAHKDHNEDFSVLQMAHAFEQATGFGKNVRQKATEHCVANAHARLAEVLLPILSDIVPARRRHAARTDLFPSG